MISKCFASILKKNHFSLGFDIDLWGNYLKKISYSILHSDAFVTSLQIIALCFLIRRITSKNQKSVSLSSYWFSSHFSKPI